MSETETDQDKIKRLERWVADLQSGMYINCVYCGHRYGPSESTPASLTSTLAVGQPTMADALREHIATCPEHPMAGYKRALDRRLQDVACSRCGESGQGFDIGSKGGTCRACGMSSDLKSFPPGGEEKQVRVGTAAFIFRSGKVLLGKRRGSHGEGTWSLPGGHVDFGEEPEDTIEREVFEETGMEVTRVVPYEVPFVNTHFPEGKQYITLFYVASCDGEPEIKEPEKCEEWGWFGLDELPKPLFGALEDVL